jgi:PAS domain-containing protein
MNADHSGSSEQHRRLLDGDLLTITDAIPIDITVLAADGTVLYVNQFALNRLGLSADDVKDKGYLKRICHPDDLDQALNERRMKLSKGVPFERVGYEVEHGCLPCAHAKRQEHVANLTDEAGVARGTVEALTQILEEDPYQHSADRQPHDCQTVCWFRLVSHSGCVIWQWNCVRRHREPRI